MNSKKKGYLLMLGAVVSITVDLFILQGVFRFWPETTLIDVIFWVWPTSTLLAAPFFLGPSKNRQRFKNMLGKHKKALFLISLITGIAIGLWYGGFALGVGAGILSLLMKTTPLWTFLLSVVFLGERITLKEFLGLMIISVGVISISSLKGEISLFTASILLVSAFLYALESFFLKIMAPGVDAPIFSFGRQVILTVFFSIVLLASGQVSLLPLPVIVLLAVAQLLGGIAYRSFFYAAHNYLQIGRLNIVGILTTIIVLIGGHLLYSDPISTQKIISAALILGGLAFFLYEQFRVNPKQPLKVQED